MREAPVVGVISNFSGKGKSNSRNSKKESESSTAAPANKSLSVIQEDSDTVSIQQHKRKVKLWSSQKFRICRFPEYAHGADHRPAPG